MRKKTFGVEQMNTKKAVQRDLEDIGISNPGEWRKALDLGTPLDGEEHIKVKLRETKIEAKEGKIQNENWQRQLDVAFEQGDFELIKTIRRVRPEQSVSAELLQKTLNALIADRSTKLKLMIQDVKNIFPLERLELDASLIQQKTTEILDEIKSNSTEALLNELSTFVSYLKPAIPVEQILEVYKRLFTTYNTPQQQLIQFSNVMNTQGLGKTDFENLCVQLYVEPGYSGAQYAQRAAEYFHVEITDQMKQRVYEQLFEKNGYRALLESNIDVKPSAHLVQRAYQGMIGAWQSPALFIDTLARIKEATDITPEYTQEQLQPTFEALFKDNNNRYISRLIALTGVFPGKDIVAQEARRIIDQSIKHNNGRTIQESLQQFGQAVQIEFEISESEIQDRYQKAIQDRQPNILIGLYNAFGIKPSVDSETARLFLVEFMDYHRNTISELEKVFDIKFKATPEEIEVKQDENLEKFRFEHLARITELIGKDTDKEKLRTALLSLLEKEALNPPHERGDFTAWEKNIKQRFEQFDITPSPEEVVPIYERFIDNQTIYSSDLAKVHKLTGVPLPADLAQKAYQKILSPGYINYGISKSGATYSYGQADAIAVILEVSGVSPELPTETVQQYYRAQLESEWSGTREIQKVAEITEVKPEFEPQDIQNLYKRWILDGKEDYIKNAKEITGIELRLDEETVAHVSQQIEAGIEKVRSGDYEKKEYGEKKFDTYSLDQDLRKVGSLTVATGVKPDTERLQSAYSEILVGDPYWATKIEQIVKATGIKPVFSPEEFQAKGQQLLEQGSLHSFERLQPYGEFTFTPKVVAKIYDALLATNRRYDEYDGNHYYNVDWVDRIKRFKATIGIAPTETQLAAIFSDIAQDGRIARSRYGDGVEEKIKFFIENFQTEITGGMVKDVAISYLTRGDVNSMKKFIEKVGVTPEFTDEDLQPHVNRLLEAKELNSLAYLKQEMKLARVPATETVVQSTYQHFVSQEDFGKENFKSLQAFKQVFELTGVPANLPAEQTDRVYKTTRFAEWQKLNEVIGTLPSNEVVQYKYLQFFTYGHSGLDKNIEAIRTLTGQSPEAETVSKALEHFASEGKIEEMANIVKIAGGKPVINPESGQQAYRKITEQFNSSRAHVLGSKLIRDFDFLSDVCEIKPDNEIMYQVYSKTFRVIDYGGPYPEIWKFLIKKFGKPDPEVVQRIYLAQLPQ